jgi:nucleotide-binding universal stress UspA family protein
MSRIVVGVDGSDTSAAALRWAVAEAKLRTATLSVVHAWSIPIPGDGLGYGWAPVAFEQLKEGADMVVTSMLADLGDAAAGLDIEQHVINGTAALSLIEASKDADLLVVGTRGLGGFGSLILGSVSHQCATHAACPVVIIR